MYTGPPVVLPSMIEAEMQFKGIFHNIIPSNINLKHRKLNLKKLFSKNTVLK